MLMGLSDCWVAVKRPNGRKKGVPVGVNKALNAETTRIR